MLTQESGVDLNRMEVAGVLLFYGGAGLLGSALIRTLWQICQGRRDWLRDLLLSAGTAALLVIAGAALPSVETRATTSSTLHDRFAPVYQFNEVHEIEVSAGRDRVYAATKATTAAEISLFQALTWIRRFGRPGPESILNAPDRQPILDVATRTTFLTLAEEPGREIVIGTLVLAPPDVHGRPTLTPGEFAAIQEPGYAKATMNFHVEEIGPRLCRVRTETRVFATDAAARRRFAAYWRAIYPGSALIRLTWLRAIRARVLGEAQGAPR